MVVPFAAGGPLDVVGRLLASRLSQILDQQVVVENVTGAGEPSVRHSIDLDVGGVDHGCPFLHLCSNER